MGCYWVLRPAPPGITLTPEEPNCHAAGSPTISCFRTLRRAALCAALGVGRDLAGPVCAVLSDAGGSSLVAVVAQNPDGTVKILRGFRR